MRTLPAGLDSSQSVGLYKQLGSLMGVISGQEGVFGTLSLAPVVFSPKSEAMGGKWTPSTPQNSQGSVSETLGSRRYDGAKRSIRRRRHGAIQIGRKRNFSFFCSGAVPRTVAQPTASPGLTNSVIHARTSAYERSNVYIRTHRKAPLGAEQHRRACTEVARGLLSVQGHQHAALGQLEQPV